MRLSKDAKVLFWVATDHACEQLTDGVIQDVELPLLFAVAGCDSAALTELSKVGILKRSGSAYQLSGHLDYTRSRNEREAAKAGARDRVARHRSSQTAGNALRAANLTDSVTPDDMRSISATEVEVKGDLETEVELLGVPTDKETASIEKERADVTAAINQGEGEGIAAAPALFMAQPALSVKRAKPSRMRWTSQELAERSKTIAMYWAQLSGSPTSAGEAEPIARLSQPMADIIATLKVLFVAERPGALGGCWLPLRKAEEVILAAESEA